MLENTKLNNSFSELEKRYGKSMDSTQVMGLPLMKLNDVFQFKNGKQLRLIHIEYRNMAVDLLRFDEGIELFTEEINDNIIFPTSKKILHSNSERGVNLES